MELQIGSLEIAMEAYNINLNIYLKLDLYIISVKNTMDVFLKEKNTEHQLDRENF